MIKKIISGVLAFTMALGMAVLPNSNYNNQVSAIGFIVFDNMEVSGDFEISKSSDKLYVTQYTGSSSDVVIPARFNDSSLSSDFNNKNIYGVARRSNFYTSSNKDKIKSVDISDGISQVGDYAFLNCTSLKKITVPDSVSSIGKYAIGYKLENSVYSKIDGVTIYCYSGTAGEKYAKDNGFDYELLDSPAHTHSYTSKVTKQPTCTAAGVKTFTCLCGDSYTETIKATGHKYTATVVKPTCIAKGYTLHKCSVCGNSYKDTYTNAKNHSYKNITVKSTYFAKGYTAKKCSTCGAIKDKKETAILQMAAPKATVSAYSIKLTWSKVTGAKGYDVYQYKSGKWTKIKTTTSTSYTVSKLPSGTSQKFAIKPYTKSGSKTVYGAFSKQLYTSTNPATVNFKLTAGSKKVAVNWNKVTGASGYKVYYKTASSGWKLLKTVNNSTTSFTKTGLTKGKTYYFTVRAYRTLNGTTYNGAFATKSVKVK
ncbi:MAG: fibronectin type III domain-containing protein [Oscillospiraceae bacterium]